MAEISWSSGSFPLTANEVDRKDVMVTVQADAALRGWYD